MSNLNFSRGFSRGNSELLRPLPEKAEEPVPLSYVETVQEAISLYLSEDGSGCSTPVNQTHRTDATESSLPSESSHAWSTTTGTLTGRSSVYSWGNDNVSFPLLEMVTTSFLKTTCPNIHGWFNCHDVNV